MELHIMFSCKSEEEPSVVKQNIQLFSDKDGSYTSTFQEL